MNTAVATTEQPRSVTTAMAHRYGMEAAAFEQTLRATVVPKDCSKEQFAAFLLVAKEYKLNPITKEIYAFPKQGGGIQPIVSVDGWANLINSHPQCDGFEFTDELNDKGELLAITCKMFRKDRTHPTTATEYMIECRRDTSTWKQWPRRMLRHKALIQAARYTFGFAGIVDPDEAEREGDVTHFTGTPGPRLVPPPAPSAEPVPAPVADEPPIGYAEAALTLPGDWDAYLDRQLEELRSSPPDWQSLVRETVADAVQGATERGEISRSQADEIMEKWETLSKDV